MSATTTRAQVRTTLRRASMHTLRGAAATLAARHLSGHTLSRDEQQALRWTLAELTRRDEKLQALQARLTATATTTAEEV